MRNLMTRNIFQKKSQSQIDDDFVNGFHFFKYFIIHVML